VAQVARGLSFGWQQCAGQWRGRAAKRKLGFGVPRAREAEAMGADAGGPFCETNPIDGASWGFGVPRAKEAEAMGADGGGFFAKRIQSMTQVGDLGYEFR